MKRKYITLIFSMIFSFIAFSQHKENLTYGLKLAALQSKISNLPEMISGRDNSLSNYSLNNKGKFGVEGGFFLNYKLPDSRVALQPEILYRSAGEIIDYENTTGKTYTLTLNYSYITIGALYKIYPLAGLNIGAGLFYSANLSPNKVLYESNEAGGLYDVATRQFYRDGINGKDNFELSFSLGYELRESAFENG